jgi:hypothetical protein
LAAGATLAVLNVKGGFTVINWPTAFVIAVAMICGAVLINKPSDAAFGADNAAVTVTEKGIAFHVVGERIRTCVPRYDEITNWYKPVCSPWG